MRKRESEFVQMRKKDVSRMRISLVITSVFLAIMSFLATYFAGYRPPSPDECLFLTSLIDRGLMGGAFTLCFINCLRIATLGVEE